MKKRQIFRIFAILCTPRKKMARKRIRRGPVSQITRNKLRIGQKLGTRMEPIMLDNGNVYRNAAGEIVMGEVSEKNERKRDLIWQRAEEIGESESKRLYHSDGRLARAGVQEVVQRRSIPGVSLSDVSPAAWKEAVFCFRTAHKMLPDTFCRMLAKKAWEKFVEFDLQRKQ